MRMMAVAVVTAVSSARFGRIDVEFRMLKGRTMGELHPSIQARFVRALRGVTMVRGWRRLASKLAGSSGQFRVSNRGIWLEGTIDSFIERQAYLYGGYERREIELFLATIPTDRRRTILDIGANVDFVGTVYSPQADFKLGGGGSKIYDFVGKSITKSCL